MLQTLYGVPHIAARDAFLLHSSSCFSTQAMNILDLNSDVLSMILSFVSPPEAMQLALTCHNAYDVAMPRFLSEVTLGCTDSMSGPEQITLFCKYMLANIKDRLRHLRALEIKEGAFVSSSEQDGRETWVSDFSCAAILADTLRQAVHLRKLNIVELEPLLASQPAVGEALSHLPRLTDVSFHYIGKCTLEMLKHTTCHPKRLEFGMWKDGSRVAGDTAAFDEYASSLQTLNLWQCACLLESFSESYVSHGVRVLGLGGRVPLLSTISREFPNVRSITFAPECSVEEETPSASWPGLDLVETSIPHPFFSCTVRRLELKYTLGTTLKRFSSNQVIARTVELVRQTKPVVLSCVLEAALGGDYLDKLVNVMPQVRFLEIEFNPRELRVHDEVHDIEFWMNRHIPRLAKLPLVGISLQGSPRKRSDNVRETIDKVAYAAAMHIPTLKYVGIGLPVKSYFSSGTGRSLTWFRVKMRMEGGEPLLEILNSGHGEAVRHEMRLLERVSS
ncbi:uncharacterized protein LAESUDRAFT_732745 [Laetiporus sulphureus 93-53]|uniref:F-box domain-containing protein n=1 Tax=Laetiporus sulphureus 93-53 TaxID=1314785 RepID=A0A165AZM4_9APHY|nr:uncharacterized protein LAESUDRAFT_732745 [Laetiporus sulphureus 93-53]KZS99951.1 hypothetical protein LAESUDRAFT_732745 [Laetiporus sulphureus 93-53]